MAVFWARLSGLQQSAAVAETAVKKEKEEREDEEGKREMHKGSSDSEEGNALWP